GLDIFETYAQFFREGPAVADALIDKLLQARPEIIPIHGRIQSAVRIMKFHDAAQRLREVLVAEENPFLQAAGVLNVEAPEERSQHHPRHLRIHETDGGHARLRCDLVFLADPEAWRSAQDD